MNGYLRARAAAKQKTSQSQAGHDALDDAFSHKFMGGCYWTVGVEH
jgi:hypothetical protein